MWEANNHSNGSSCSSDDNSKQPVTAVRVEAAAFLSLCFSAASDVL